MRFLVVKKPAGNAYGLGLDACEICGIAGYYERGDEDVVCRRCDVVYLYNKAAKSPLRYIRLLDQADAGYKQR